MPEETRGNACGERDQELLELFEKLREDLRISDALKDQMEFRDMPFKMGSNHRDVRGSLIAGIDQGMESI